MSRIRARRAVRRALQSYARSRRIGASRDTNTSQSAALASVRSAYRFGNPKSVSFSNVRQIDFWRTTQINLRMNHLNGFSGNGYYLGFDFSLGNVFGYISTGFQYALPVSGASEFQSLFDYYKIKCVKCTFYFSANSGGTTHPGFPLPHFLICNDYDDAQGPETLNSMQERNGVRRVQLGAEGKPFVQWVKPCVQTYTTQTDPSSGTQSQINAGIGTNSRWLNLAANAIRHSGVKLFWDIQGRTDAADIGNLCITFEICYTMSGWR